MKNIPFPNPHDADALNDYLDALAAGTQANPVGDVQATAAAMHALANQSLPSIPGAKSGVHTGGESMQTAAYSPPISNRTRRSRALTPKPSRLEPWLSGILVAGLLISMIGYAWWNGPGGGPDENNNLAWAPGTAEALTPKPLNSETSPWIVEYETDDCTETSNIESVEVSHSDKPAWDPQGYGVVGAADRTAASQISNQYRAMRGCENLGSAWAYWSEARIYEHQRVLNQTNRAELEEMQDYFSDVYPEQFMATAEALQVSPEVRQEWESRLQSNILTQPIPLGAKLNPAWAVELSDGRVAIPATFMYSVHDPAIVANGLPADYPASTVVIVFTMEDNEWKYDDSLQLCIVNCQSGMGNPLSPEVEEWAAPPAPVTCSSEEGIPFAGLESSPISDDRSYVTVGTPAPESLDHSIGQLNVMVGCTESTEPIYTLSGAITMGELNEPGSQQSEAMAPFFLQSERGGTQIIAENPQLSQIDVVDSKVFSTSINGMAPAILMPGNMENIARTKYQNNVFDPDGAILLEDGRIAMTTSVLLSNQDRGAIYYEGDPELFPMPILILKHVDGELLIDEAISRPRYVGLATPSYSWWWDSRYAPTPLASLESEFDLDSDLPAWTQPVPPAECPEDATRNAYDPDNPSGTQYTQEDYDQVSNERNYEIVGPADPEDAAAVVTVVRQSYGCMAVGKSFPFSSARFEYENRTTAGRESLDAISEQRSEATDNISIWLETELGLTPVDMYVVQDPEELTLDGSESLITQAMYNPAYAVEFADGRIGVIPSAVSYTEFSVEINEQTVPGYGPNMLIFANVDGTWLLDESLPVCLGDCSGVPGATPIPGGDVMATPTD